MKRTQGGLALAVDRQSSYGDPSLGDLHTQGGREDEASEFRGRGRRVEANINCSMPVGVHVRGPLECLLVIIGSSFPLLVSDGRLNSSN